MGYNEDRAYETAKNVGSATMKGLQRMQESHERSKSSYEREQQREIEKRKREESNR